MSPCRTRPGWSAGVVFSDVARGGPAACREWARQKPRFGYRRLHAVLERHGQAVNVKRVYRLYREVGLAVRRRKRKRLVRGSVAELRPTRPNQEWAMDSIMDGLANGRLVRILSVVDVFTRECLALEQIPVWARDA